MVFNDRFHPYVDPQSSFRRKITIGHQLNCPLRRDLGPQVICSAGRLPIAMSVVPLLSLYVLHYGLARYSPTFDPKCFFEWRRTQDVELTPPPVPVGAGKPRQRGPFVLRDQRLKAAAARFVPRDPGRRLGLNAAAAERTSKRTPSARCK
jgi:hypothetical protein